MRCQNSSVKISYMHKLKGTENLKYFNQMPFLLELIFRNWPSSYQRICIQKLNLSETIIWDWFIQIEQKLRPSHDQIGMVTINALSLVAFLKYFVIIGWECLTLIVKKMVKDSVLPSVEKILCLLPVQKSVERLY